MRVYRIATNHIGNIRSRDPPAITEGHDCELARVSASRGSGSGAELLCSLEQSAENAVNDASGGSIGKAAQSSSTRPLRIVRIRRGNGEGVEAPSDAATSGVVAEHDFELSRVSASRLSAANKASLGAKLDITQHFEGKATGEKCPPGRARTVKSVAGVCLDGEFYAGKVRNLPLKNDVNNASGAALSNRFQMTRGVDSAGKSLAHSAPSATTAVVSGTGSTGDRSQAKPVQIDSSIENTAPSFCPQQLEFQIARQRFQKFEDIPPVENNACGTSLASPLQVAVSRVAASRPRPPQSWTCAQPMPMPPDDANDLDPCHPSAPAAFDKQDCKLERVTASQHDSTPASSPPLPARSGSPRAVTISLQEPDPARRSKKAAADRTPASANATSSPRRSRPRSSDGSQRRLESRPGLRSGSERSVGNAVSLSEARALSGGSIGKAASCPSAGLPRLKTAATAERALSNGATASPRVQRRKMGGTASDAGTQQQAASKGEDAAHADLARNLLDSGGGLQSSVKFVAQDSADNSGRTCGRVGSFSKAKAGEVSASSAVEGTKVLGAAQGLPQQRDDAAVFSKLFVTGQGEGERRKGLGLDVKEANSNVQAWLELPEPLT